jgi:hypothetical protein
MMNGAELYEGNLSGWRMFLKETIHLCY